jgi:hypothetical protein
MAWKVTWLVWLVKEDSAAKFCTSTEGAAAEGCYGAGIGLETSRCLTKFCIGCVEATRRRCWRKSAVPRNSVLVSLRAPRKMKALLGKFVAGG